jgi:hypothetical protein
VDCQDRPRKENAKGTGERCHKEGDPLSVLGDGGENGSRKVDGMGTATATGPLLVRVGLAKGVAEKLTSEYRVQKTNDLRSWAKMAEADLLISSLVPSTTRFSDPGSVGCISAWARLFSSVQCTVLNCAVGGLDWALVTRRRARHSGTHADSPDKVSKG